MSAHRLLAASLILFVACQPDDHTDPGRTLGGNPASEVPLTRFATGSSAFAQYSGIAAPRQTVVRDSSGWRQLWEEIHATTSPVPDLPSVDFAQEMVVVVALGSQPTGGYDITLTGATLDDSSLTIAVLEKHPGGGCMLTQALTQPLDLAKVPRHDGAVRFTESQTETSCGS